MWGRGPPGETNSVMVKWEENKQGMREDEPNNSEQSPPENEFLNPAGGKVVRGGHDPSGT